MYSLLAVARNIIRQYAFVRVGLEIITIGMPQPSARRRCFNNAMHGTYQQGNNCLEGPSKLGFDPKKKEKVEVHSPYSVTFLIKTRIFKWCVVWCGSQNRYEKDMFEEIGVCV